MQIQNPHDKFFRDFISDNKYAVELLSKILPEHISISQDWSRLQAKPGTFISDAHRELRTDALFHLPAKPGRDKDMELYLLVEHKSQPVKKINEQLLVYMAYIYNREEEKKPVIPLVFYHGKKKWDVPTSFIETFGLTDEQKAKFSPFIPDFTYYLFDLSAEEHNLLRFSLEVQGVLYVLRHIWEIDRPEHLHVLGTRFFRHIRETDEALWKKVLVYFLGSVERDTQEVIEDIPQEEGGHVMSTFNAILEQTRQEATKVATKVATKEANLRTARAMFAKGYPLEDVSEITGLTINDLQKAGLTQ